MCLIIHRVKGSNVPNDVLEYNRVKNDDGFGLAWRDDEGLHHRKYGPESYDKFRKQLKRLDRQPKIEYTAHFRMATTGAPCRELSHPFEYTDPIHGKVLVFHNGVINIRAAKGESDTSQFVKDVLSKMEPGWWQHEHYRFLVEGAIGYSRMLIMTKDESVYLNEQAWLEKSGIMYSTDPGGSHSKYTPSRSWSAPSKSSTGSGLYVPAGSNKPMKVVKYEPKSDDSCDYGTGFVDADDEVQTWHHQGHLIESLSSERLSKGSEDIAVEAICVQCQTMGEVYVIGGTTFIDVPHGHVKDVDDEDEEDFLDSDSATMKAVYAN